MTRSTIITILAALLAGLLAAQAAIQSGATAAALWIAVAIAMLGVIIPAVKQGREVKRLRSFQRFAEPSMTADSRRWILNEPECRGLKPTMGPEAKP